MKTKAACKAGVDIAMTVLFLGQMGYHLMDNRLHEWMGVALCLLFLAHHALNGGWHRGLLKGRYSPQRTLLTIVDGLLTLAMIAVIASAILVSRHVFGFLGLSLRATGRRIHMPATMWAFVLTGLHLGLRWNRVLNAAQHAAKGKCGLTALWMARILLLGIGALGVYEFIARGLYMEMLMLREFAFLAYGESLGTFVVAYVAVWVAWGAVSNALNRLLRQLNGKRREEFR